MKKSKILILAIFVISLTALTAVFSYAFVNEVGEAPMMIVSDEATVFSSDLWDNNVVTYVDDKNSATAWGGRSQVSTEHELMFAYNSEYVFVSIKTLDDSQTFSTMDTGDDHGFDGDVAILQFDLSKSFVNSEYAQRTAPWYCFSILEDGSFVVTSTYSGGNSCDDIIVTGSYVENESWTVVAAIPFSRIIEDSATGTEGLMVIDPETVADMGVIHNAKLIYVDAHIYGTNSYYDDMCDGYNYDGDIVVHTRNFTPCNVIPGTEYAGTDGNPQQARTCGIYLYTTDHVCVEGDWEVAVEASCTEQKKEVKKCTLCAREMQVKYGGYGHDDGEWIIVKEPSCANGFKEKRCTMCETVLDTEVIASLYGHNNNSQVVYGVRMNEDGKKELYCQVCELVIDIDATNIDLVFEDTPKNTWYGDAVGYIYTLGYMGSTSTEKDTFEPNTTTTRSMFVTILGRFHGIDTTEYTETPFSDVKEGQWYTPYVAWAYENGIVTGYTDGSFGVTDTITREQIVTILYRYDAPSYTYEESSLESYTDNGQIGSYAKEAVAWAVDNGIVRGTSKTTLAPKKTASRAEIAQIILNYFDYLLR
ncbi:MAG: S-layer homology domain-containing protein [Ruminococcaceae bacterium]|nr:S-layer homology domain-containing protein [Oscillospiraceae bacterium]